MYYKGIFRKFKTKDSELLQSTQKNSHFLFHLFRKQNINWKYKAGTVWNSVWNSDSNWCLTGS